MNHSPRTNAFVPERHPTPSDRVLSRTESVCPVCLKKLPASRVTDGTNVFLEKICPDHGHFQTVIWRGKPAWESWIRPKIPASPSVCATRPTNGCPFDCGLCQEHQQITCTALLEITNRCNLSCAYCFASSGTTTVADPSADAIRFAYETLRKQAPGCNIQISGGEPTMRNDLPQIIQMGCDIGFGFIQLNTNGLRIAREPDYAFQLKDAGLSSVFLQFDGVSDRVYERMRGIPLMALKQKAVEHCGNAGLGVVLVPVVVPGINDHEIGAILEFGLKRSPVVRGVHYQPVSYFGRCPTTPAQDQDRITLPEIMRALERQSGGLVHATDFRPPGCEHAMCSFSGKYLASSANRLYPLVPRGKMPCCSRPEPALVGAQRAIAATARQWGAPQNIQPPAHDPIDLDISRSMDLDQFLESARNRTFSISGMAFQDAWNLDLERLKGCCIHVVSPDGRMVPFCAWNLTDSGHRPLYRNTP